MQTETQKQTSVPTVAAVVTHAVEAYDVWKRAFDQHASARRAAGITATHINRHADDPNRVSVYLASTDAAKLDGFLASGDTLSTMRDAGVKGPPHIAKITPVEELTLKDRPLEGVIVKHEVKDYATWKSAFDGHATARARAGIVGHAVNRTVANPNVVVVYLQAESLEALKAFAASADLKDVMKNAGVVGAPDLIFAHGGLWES